MNAAADIDAETAAPLDDGVEQGRARLAGLSRAGEVGQGLLGLVERLAARTARMVDAAGEGAEGDVVALKAVAAAKDLAQAYGKICRSIRQNGLLEAKVETALRDQLSGLDDARRARALKAADAEAAQAAAEAAAERQRVHGPRLAREAAVAEVLGTLSVRVAVIFTLSSGTWNSWATTWATLIFSP